MADCSKTLAFTKELHRMCMSVNGECDYCVFYKPCIKSCIDSITQYHINQLQEWSDCHPIKTRQGEFLKMFPNAEIKDGIIQICPFSVDGNRGCYVKELEYSKCQKCRQEYWLEEIE